MSYSTNYLLFSFFLYSMCMYVYVCACVRVCICVVCACGSQRIICEIQFLPFFKRLLGIELRSLGLVASSFTHWDILPFPTPSFLLFLLYCLCFIFILSFQGFEIYIHLFLIICYHVNILSYHLFFHIIFYFLNLWDVKWPKLWQHSF